MYIRILLVNMKKTIKNVELLLNFSAEVGGVFSLAELSSLFNITNQQTLWGLIKQFEETAILTRFCRGIYITKNFDSQVLFSKVRGDAYISLGSALAYHRVIGTESPYLISGVVLGKACEFTGKINISYSRISKDLFFGFSTLPNGAKIADPEKAFLDTLYFYQHGKTYYFNIFQDINTSLLSDKKIISYLAQFKNQKFQTFVRNYLNGKI